MVLDTSLDFTVLPKELKLILSVLKPEANLAVIQQNQKLSINLDWDSFLRLVYYHGIFPSLSVKLKKSENNWFPQKVLDELDKGYRHNTFKMLFLTRELEKISQLFGEQDIRVLQLKGPVLAAELYGDISLRPSMDLDILVDINDLERVEKLLIANGYHKDEFFTTVIDDWKWRIHHMNFVHPETKIKLEVHWRLNPGTNKEPSFDELWTRRRTSSLLSYPIYYFSPEDLFLNLITHGARHGWSRLTWIMDIDRMLQQQLDLGKLKQLLKKYQYSQVGGQALILAQQLLGTDIQAAVKMLGITDKSTRLAQNALFYLKQIVNLHAENVPEEISTYHKRHLYDLMSYRQKLVFILSWFYPYPEDAAILPLPQSLHFLYVPLRPALWAWRKITQHSQAKGGC